MISSPAVAAFLAEFNRGGVAEEEEDVEQIAPMASALSGHSIDYPPPIPETIVEEAEKVGNDLQSCCCTDIPDESGFAETC